jgi:hypothetical protein
MSKSVFYSYDCAWESFYKWTLESIASADCVEEGGGGGGEFSDFPVREIMSAV